MIFTYLLMLAGLVPMILFLFALKEHRHYRILLRCLCICLVIWLFVYGIATMVNFHYWSAHGMPFFPAWGEINIMFFLMIAIFAIIFAIVIVTSLPIRVSIGEWFAQYGKVLVAMGTFCLTILIIFIFIMPAGQKYAYSLILEKGQRQLAQVVLAEDDPVSVVLVTSQQNCFSRSSSSGCRDSYYENLVMAKNNHEQGLWVRMEIAFFNSRNEVMDVMQYGPVYLAAGETKPILPHYEADQTSVWNRWTNHTKRRTTDIQYRYVWQ